MFLTYRRWISTGLVILLGLLPVTGVALAQELLAEHYVAPDRSFQFSYPTGWELNTSDDGAVTLVGDEYVLHFLGPVLLNAYGLGYTTDPHLLIKEIINVLEDVEPQDLYPLQLGNRTGLQYTYLEQERQGYLIAVPFTDGTIGLVDAFRLTGDLMVDDPVILTLAANFNSVVTTAFPDTLHQTQNGWQQATQELAERGLIPSGQALIFVEDHAYFAGQGSFFTPLARDKPAADLVMGGQLAYTPGSEGYEDCVLASRIDVGPDDTVYAYLDVGLNNRGEVFFFDFTGDETTSSFGALPLTTSLDQPHDFLLLLLDNHLTVYMDGQLMFENRIVEDRAGSFGLGLTGSGPHAYCAGQDIWAVEIPYVQPGLCEVSTTTPVNRRTGPGTNHEASGRLLPGISVQVMGQATGSNGYTWWLLADDSWVREDVVNEIGSCATVPDAFEDLAPASSESA